ncbi:MAG TPA: hypothetical protein DCK93_01415 [Blastocatellia bacterium]|jgi:hypothetical protein|nr:hypothetical protein [Blastocatellia bacterium]HAF21561.1 hypothetical protein [Blastocatellia bacterium]
MANYYIRYDCPDCGELHGIYDYIEYSDDGLSGCRLSEVYSQKQLARFGGLIVHCWPETVVAIDVDRLVLASNVL